MLGLSFPRGLISFGCSSLQTWAGVLAVSPVKDSPREPQEMVRDQSGLHRASSSHFLFSDHVSTTSQGNMLVSLAVIICLTSLTFLLVIPPADSITAKCLLEINPLYTTCGYFCLQLYITS